MGEISPLSSKEEQNASPFLHSCLFQILVLYSSQNNLPQMQNTRLVSSSGSSRSYLLEMVKILVFGAGYVRSFMLWPSRRVSRATPSTYSDLIRGPSLVKYSHQNAPRLLIFYTLQMLLLFLSGRS